ncbi:sugar ABC transporter substrate-binding protein [Anaerocolumna sp. AGMB13025]|uniref:multiple monosaccharide ABC transporter substrate-binding protein n=1 Tax=Anaerocolumna sp. AGMB13025 TaxID=3039116 RepID=UPI00242031F8|nr:multiple monosaccharide ABC transporter substrate-binding protein [Anaerocolumna sp. AGMB13025]WFR59532.1 sugar ABC transporter substrate-binding protein [Anaerocolumna sp. AGMB13025]
MKLKKLIALGLASMFVFSLTGCAKTNNDKLVGVAMPTKSSQRWIQDGDNMKKQLEAQGYTVDLQYGEDSVDNQVAQIENMISKGAKVLVVASIDGSALTDVLKKAADAGIKTIAYDRLIRDTDNVSYYATFDNKKVGQLQAESIVKGLDLANQAGPFNIELFGGSPDDNNAYFFYDGAMEVLQPFIDQGKLVIKSGQTGMDKVSTLRWDGATAQARMDNILSAFYTSDKVSAVLSPYDGISIGIISSLKGVGYGSTDMPMPIVSGQDAEIPSVKSIIAGEQYSTIFKDTRILAEKCVKMVDAVYKGTEPEINDTTSYDNGVKVVPSYLCDPVPVDKSNYKEILIDSNYYTEDQLK